MTYKLDDVTILLVDDHRPILSITKEILLSFGIGRVLTAHDGEAALEKYHKENPDLIIADWLMEPMNGIEMTQRIRADMDNGPNPYVPIILMTGFSERSKVIQARDTGITEFLAKPFNAKDLYLRITQVIERPRQFVRSDDFFGPDRRRVRNDDYQGRLKREDDDASDV